MGERGSNTNWFNLGGGDGAGNRGATGTGGGAGISLPNINIPGFRREEPTFTDEMSEVCPKLTYQQRIIGFAVCIGLGYLLSFMSTLMVLSSDLRRFATLYVLGSFIALSATGFLLGPRRQCKKMFHKSRRVACITYLVLLVAVLVVAVVGADFIIVLVLLILQAMAAIWYSASYIPYGRAMIKSVVCPCLKDLEGQQQQG
ncbi:unnamed protein product [Discosporangium mesarthrocarpum]